MKWTRGICVAENLLTILKLMVKLHHKPKAKDILQESLSNLKEWSDTYS